MVLSLVSAVPAHAQRAEPEDFFQRRNELMLECAQRHLDLGLWCREKGLVREATGELLLAEELADGRHAGVGLVLSLLRRFEGDFWKKRRKPSPSAAKGYPEKAEKALREDEEQRLDLARWASLRGLEGEAWLEYERIVRDRGDALELDGKGRVVLGTGPLPEGISQRLREGAIEINGRLYLRDDFLKHVPALAAIFEVDGEHLRVRTPRGLGVAQALHELGCALLPILEADLGGRPAGRLDIFVFEQRADYATCVTSAGLAAFASVSGVADGRTRTAILCAEGLDEAQLQGLVLHELAHLFDLALSRAALPHWYREGLAEHYGAEGSFEWERDRLLAGGVLGAQRRQALQESPGSVASILAFEPLAAWAAGTEVGLVGYARCWALLRYLRTAAPEPIQAAFHTWEDQCHGAGLGAVVGDRRARDPSAATARFHELLGANLGELERGYAAFVAEL
jgi:hypothetical protein